MICRSKSARCNPGPGDPSPQRIRELAAEIRKDWSPKTFARRATQGAKRVQMMTIATVDFRRELSDEI